MNLNQLIQTLALMIQEPPRPGPRRVCQPQIKPQFRGLRIAAMTGPMNLLQSRNLSVIADVENLSYSARNAGYKFSYSALGAALKRVASGVRLHACFSQEPNHPKWGHYFQQRGWTPHARDIAYVKTGQAVRKEANADAVVAFHCGRLTAESDSDILIATGDGGLATDIANSIASIWPDRLIFTLAFPGAASARLKATNGSAIAGNLLVGMDCLHPLNQQ